MRKPASCPFCGNANTDVDVFDGFYRVTCDDCGAHGPVFSGDDKPAEEKRSEAIEGWEIRITQTRKHAKP